jgi:hypothetical protein
MDQNMVIETSYRSGHIQDFVQLEEINAALRTAEELRQIAIEVPFNAFAFIDPHVVGGQTTVSSLPQLTKKGIPSREPTYYPNSPPHPEHEQHPEEFVRRIVVMGAPGSVEDLCLVWNLRAQRRSAQFFPQWINPAWIADQDALQSIHWGLRWESLGLAEDTRGAPLHLLSASLSHDEVHSALPDFGVPTVVSDRTKLDRYFTADFRTGLVQSSTTNFVEGTADVAVPDYSQLGDWEYWERIGWTGDVAGYRLPRVRQNHLPQVGPLPVRSASDGLAGFINVPHDAPGDLWTFSTMSGWSMVEAVAADAGYNARVSDKGQRAIATMELIGGETGLRLLASSRVYGLIERMAESIEQRQAMQKELRRALGKLDIATLSRQQEDVITEAILKGVTQGAQFDRQHFTWNDIKNALGDGVGQTYCNRLVDWLVERRIVIQGYSFTCTNCGISRWYSVNHLSEVQTCEGCNYSSRKPVSSNVLHWRYRLNETVAQAVDQGVLPHLLAVNQIVGWREDSRAPLYGCLPGVQLIPRDEVNLPDIEVDVFVIKGGRVIVGECKRGGDQISAKTVERFARLGHLLQCSRIIYATAGDFDSDLVALCDTAEKSKPAVVEFWDKNLLFDRFPQSAKMDEVSYLHRVLDI